MANPGTCQDSEIRQMSRISKSNCEVAGEGGEEPSESGVPEDKRMLFKNNHPCQLLLKS